MLTLSEQDRLDNPEKSDDRADPDRKHPGPREPECETDKPRKSSDDQDDHRQDKEYNADDSQASHDTGPVIIIFAHRFPSSSPVCWNIG